MIAIVGPALALSWDAEATVGPFVRLAAGLLGVHGTFVLARRWLSAPVGGALALASAAVVAVWALLASGRALPAWAAS
jgi:hypothetical protein